MHVKFCNNWLFHIAKITYLFVNEYVYSFFNTLVKECFVTICLQKKNSALAEMQELSDDKKQ